MTVLVIIGIVVLLFVFAICRAAAKGDRMLENLNCNRDQMSDLTYREEPK